MRPIIVFMQEDELKGAKKVTLVRRTGKMGVLLTNTMRTATLLILVISIFGRVDCSKKPYGGVLQSTIAYSPLPPKPEYKSNATFNPLGMEHVYLMTNTFLSIIQRRDMMPIGTMHIPPDRIKF